MPCDRRRRCLAPCTRDRDSADTTVGIADIVCVVVHSSLEELLAMITGLVEKSTVISVFNADVITGRKVYLVEKSTSSTGGSGQHGVLPLTDWHRRQCLPPAHRTKRAWPLAPCTRYRWSFLDLNLLPSQFGMSVQCHIEVVDLGRF